jgi:hypothetical protein
MSSDDDRFGGQHASMPLGEISLSRSVDEPEGHGFANGLFDEQLRRDWPTCPLWVDVDRLRPLESRYRDEIELGNVVRWLPVVGDMLGRAGVGIERGTIWLAPDRSMAGYRIETRGGRCAISIVRPAGSETRCGEWPIPDVPSALGGSGGTRPT